MIEALAMGLSMSVIGRETVFEMGSEGQCILFILFFSFSFSEGW
jgi:hypothetical protein